ncbi:MAG: hypothetical protein RLZZ282_1437 [Verrucomicrobiota bacterium]
MNTTQTPQALPNKITGNLTRRRINTLRTLIAGTVAIASYMAGFAQAKEAKNPAQTTQASQTRILTSTNGKRVLVKLIEKTPDSVIVLRDQDKKHIAIPFNSLIDSDKQFLTNWTPPPTPPKLIASSVSISGNSTLTRGAYPCQLKPRYTNSAGRGHWVKGPTITFPADCKNLKGLISRCPTQKASQAGK